ncbi:hypothetical protein F4803DRAFT_68874 [Xylaria telfairii]|nr:hypothetical protein F4803DRAFT_68874 [Xylaria telfairii]
MITDSQCWGIPHVIGLLRTIGLRVAPGRCRVAFAVSRYLLCFFCHHGTTSIAACVYVTFYSGFFFALNAKKSTTSFPASSRFILHKANPARTRLLNADACILYLVVTRAADIGSTVAYESWIWDAVDEWKWQMRLKTVRWVLLMICEQAMRA